MIIDKKTIVKITKQNIDYFKNLGYECNLKDNIEKLIEIENEGFLQLGDRPLFCAESQPSLTYQNQLISVLHFTKISFVRETSVRIGPSRILYWYDHRSIVLEGATPKIIQLPEGQDVVLNIVNPSKSPN